MKRKETTIAPEHVQKITEAICSWYDHNRRTLPWRALPGITPNPYHVWISEMMLQQTQVQTVIPYFLRFIEKFPDFGTLAKSSLTEVLCLWQGLGYYHRAESLWKAAQVLSEQKDWPHTPDAWHKLPGVGPYIAAAICAIAWNFPVLPVDANIRRILERLLGFFDQAPAQKLKTAQLVAAQWPEKFPNPKQICWGDLAQGFMDFGTEICTAKSPRCRDCPMRAYCCYAQADQAARTNPTPAKTRPVRYGIALCLLDENGALYLKQEHERLLRGLMRVPIWTIESDKILDKAEVRHMFSHFEWRVQICVGHVRRRDFTSESDSLALCDIQFNAPCPPALSSFFPLKFQGVWVEDIAEHPMSSLMRKIYKKVSA